jgi:2,3-bisphosphoglycerate-independent phosphoglycerate mutase
VELVKRDSKKNLKRRDRPKVMPQMITLWGLGQVTKVKNLQTKFQKDLQKKNKK